MDFEYTIPSSPADYIAEDACSFDGSSSDDGSARDLGSQFVPLVAATASISEVLVDAPEFREEERDVSSLLSPGRAATISKIRIPRLPVNFNNLLPKARLRALKQCTQGAAPNTDHGYSKDDCTCTTAYQAGLPDVERIPVGFKTESLGQIYLHIVLLVHHGGKWGAFGISRCSQLMNKDLTFDRMASVIENFKRAYEGEGHMVLKIRVGLPVEHNITSTNFVCWRHLNLNLKHSSWEECVEKIDKHVAKGKRLWDLWILSGKGKDPHISNAIRKAPLDMKHSSCNDKAKKKLGSRNATVKKAKSMLIEHKTTIEGSPSLKTCSESNETTVDTSNLETCTDTIEVAVDESTFRGCSSESPVVAEALDLKEEPNTMLELKKCFEVAVDLEDSKFHHPKDHSSSSLADASDNFTRRSKLMKTATSLPKTTKIIDKTLAVSRGFLGAKCFPRRPGNGIKIKVPRTRSSMFREVAEVGITPLHARLPANVFYQTLNAEVLIQNSPKQF